MHEVSKFRNVCRLSESSSEPRLPGLSIVVKSMLAEDICMRARSKFVLSSSCVLFLHEMPKFNRKTLDVLRLPLDEGKITISRGHEQHDVSRRLQVWECVV
jgi:predicted ATPase with chaperone activity